MCALGTGVRPCALPISPLKVAVTGAAGQIGYSLLFRLASGALGDRPIELRLLEITPALKALEGVVLEPDDCAFPNLTAVSIGDDAQKSCAGLRSEVRSVGKGCGVTFRTAG